MLAKGEYGIDPAIAGNMDLPVNALSPEVGGAELGRCEQQLGIPIDREAEFLLRPGLPQVVSPEARLHMRNRDSGQARGKRPGERARRISLHHSQLGRFGNKQRYQRAAGDPDMSMGVFLARAIEANSGVKVEAVVGRPKRGMLAGEDERRHQSTCGKRRRDGFDLDGFGTGTDNENYATGQLSPWLGRGRVALEAPRLNENCRRRPGA